MFTKTEKIGWSALIFVQVALALFFMSSYVFKPATEREGRVDGSNDAVQLLENASKGTQLNEVQQRAVLTYCAGIRQELTSEINERQDYQSQFWTTVLLAGVMIGCFAGAQLLLLFLRARSATNT